MIRNKYERGREKKTGSLYKTSGTRYPADGNPPVDFQIKIISQLLHFFDGLSLQIFLRENINIAMAEVGEVIIRLREIKFYVFIIRQTDTSCIFLWYIRFLHAAECRMFIDNVNSL